MYQLLLTSTEFMQFMAQVNNLIKRILIVSEITLLMVYVFALVWNEYYYSNIVISPTVQNMESYINDGVFVISKSGKDDPYRIIKFLNASNGLSFIIQSKKIQPFQVFDYLLEYQDVCYRFISFDFPDKTTAKTYFDIFIDASQQATIKSACEIPRNSRFAEYYVNGDISGPSVQIWYHHNHVYILLSDSSQTETSVQRAMVFKNILIMR